MTVWRDVSAAAAAAAPAVVVAVPAFAAADAAEGGLADGGVSMAGHWGVGCQGRPELRQPAGRPCVQQVLQLCRALAPDQVWGLHGNLDTGAF
jgi:hypothetical protein